MNILLVDDHRNGARIASVAIRSEGHSCVVAHSLSEAASALAGERFDAVFLDLDLRGESGLDLIGLLDEGCDKPLLVLHSAADRENVSAEAARRGAFGWLAKPYSLADLREMLSRLSVQPPSAA